MATESSVTRESIERAKADMLAERARVERLTGLRITDDGTIQKPGPRLVVAHCHKPGCLFVAARSTETEALRSVATHYSLKHGVSLVRAQGWPVQGGAA